MASMKELSSFPFNNFEYNSSSIKYLENSSVALKSISLRLDLFFIISINLPIVYSWSNSSKVFNFLTRDNKLVNIFSET